MALIFRANLTAEEPGFVPNSVYMFSKFNLGSSHSYDFILVKSNLGSTEKVYATKFCP